MTTQKRSEWGSVATRSQFLFVLWTMSLLEARKLERRYQMVAVQNPDARSRVIHVRSHHATAATLRRSGLRRWAVGGGGGCGQRGLRGSGGGGGKLNTAVLSCSQGRQTGVQSDFCVSSNSHRRPNCAVTAPAGQKTKCTAL